MNCNYKVDTFVGRGSYGQIYNINYANKSAVIKTMKLESNGLPSSDILNEIECLYLLKEIKNIPRIYDVCPYPDHIDAIIEKLDIDLHKLAQKLSYMERIKLIGKLISDISHALLAMGKFKLSHNDVKPANILYDFNTKTFKLIDFGKAGSMVNFYEYPIVGTYITQPFETLYYITEYDKNPNSGPNDIWALGMCVDYFIYKKYIVDSGDISSIIEEITDDYSNSTTGRDLAEDWLNNDIIPISYYEDVTLPTIDQNILNNVLKPMLNFNPLSRLKPQEILLNLGETIPSDDWIDKTASDYPERYDDISLPGDLINGFSKNSYFFYMISELYLRVKNTTNLLDKYDEFDIIYTVSYLIYELARVSDKFLNVKPEIVNDILKEVKYKLYNPNNNGMARYKENKNPIILRIKDNDLLNWGLDDSINLEYLTFKLDNLEDVLDNIFKNEVLFKSVTTDHSFTLINLICRLSQFGDYSQYYNILYFLIGSNMASDDYFLDRKYSQEIDKNLKDILSKLDYHIYSDTVYNHINDKDEDAHKILYRIAYATLYVKNIDQYEQLSLVYKVKNALNNYSENRIFSDDDTVNYIISKIPKIPPPWIIDEKFEKSVKSYNYRFRNNKRH